MLLTKRAFLTGLIGSFALSCSCVLAQENATTLINQIRRDHHLGPLTEDANLTKMALYQAELMASRKKVSHSVRWNNGFIARLRKFNIRGPAAENIAAGQPTLNAVLQAWMNSPGHRKNMLDPEFTKFGLAQAVNPEKPNYLYWALVFNA